MSWLDALKGVGVFFWTLLVGSNVVPVSDREFVYTTTNYSGIYSLVSLYDSYEMTTLDLSIPSYTLELSPSLAEDDPNDDEDLYDMVLSNGVDDMIVAQMRVAGDISEDSGQRITDEIVGLYVVSTTIPATVRSDDEWSVEEAIYYLVPYFTQIRFYDGDQTELVLGGPSGSVEVKRGLV